MNKIILALDTTDLEKALTIANTIKDKYNLLVDLQQKEINHYQDFPPIYCNDGIQLYIRKNI